MSTRRLVLAGIAVAVVIAGFLSHYASADPDGLEYVAGQQGFSDTAEDHPAQSSPLAGYTTAGVEDQRLSGAVAGVTGTVLVLVVAGGAGLLLRRRGTATEQP